MDDLPAAAGALQLHRLGGQPINWLALAMPRRATLARYPGKITNDLPRPSNGRFTRRLWGRFNPNHWDPIYARATGLPASIQTGEMTSACLFEMCVNHFGAAMFENARFSCKYVASTIADEVITTHGTVREKQSKGTSFRFIVDVWCDNEAGEE